MDGSPTNYTIIEWDGSPTNYTIIEWDGSPTKDWMDQGESTTANDVLTDHLWGRQFQLGSLGSQAARFVGYRMVPKVQEAPRRTER